MLALANARTPEEVIDVANKAEAMRRYAQRCKLGLAAQNCCAEVRLRAERKLGGLLAATEMHKGGRPPETPSGGEGVSPVKLHDLGINYKFSHQVQRIASVPEPEFERYIADAEAEAVEITTADMLRLAGDNAGASPRHQLLRPLELVQPALGRGQRQFDDAIWFDGERVTAWNGTIAIDAPCNLGIVGGVNGRVLINFLKTLPDDPSIVARDNTIIIDCRRRNSKGKCELPLVPLEFRAFPPLPSLLDARPVKFDGYAARALGKIMSTRGAKDVWAFPEGNELSFYAVTAKTMMRACLPLPPGFQAQPVDVDFCKCLPALCGDGGELFVIQPDRSWREYAETMTVARAPSGARLFGFCREHKNGGSFASTFQEKMPKQDALPMALARLILEQVEMKSVSEIELHIDVHLAATLVIPRKMTLDKHSGQYIESSPRLSFNDEVRHNPITAKFDAAPLRENMRKFDTFAVSKDFFAMYSSDGAAYFVAASREPELLDSHLPDVVDDWGAEIEE